MSCYYVFRSNSPFRREKYKAFYNLSLTKQSESEKKGHFIKINNTDPPNYTNILKKKIGLTRVNCNMLMKRIN